MRLIKFFLVVFFALAFVANAEAHSYKQDQYDFWFRKYTLLFFSRAVDWKWFKAQAIAESALDPTAVSPAGAVGLMQIMPRTGEDLAKELGVRLLLTHPRINIMMGIYYDRKLWDNWKARRSRMERLRLTFASYNAGLGNILRAQKLAKKDKKCNHLFWNCIKRYLKRITGRHSEETVDYVERIEYNYLRLTVRGIKADIKTLAAISTILGVFVSNKFS